MQKCTQQCIQGSAGLRSAPLSPPAVMSPTSTAPKAAFNELSHSLALPECCLCLAGGTDGTSATAGASWGRVGASGTLFLLGGAREGQKKGSCLCLVCCFKGNEGRSWRQEQWPRVIVASISERECSPGMWEIWTLRAWKFPYFPVLPLSG